MRRLLVDARPLTHPTAAGRGIGNHVAGILEGLAATSSPAVALVEHDGARALVPLAFPPGDVELLSRASIRRFAEPGVWFLATSMYLHPVSLDPIPRSVTDARLPVAALLYDVIPYRYPEQYLRQDDPARQARLRRLWAHTVELHLANSAFVASTAVEELGLDPALIRVVGASANARFRPPAPGSSSPLDRPYVVSITGGDPRKNTIGLLRAWGRVDAAIRGRTTLVVVATPPAAVLDHWRAVAAEAGCGDQVEFAAGRTDDEVVRLLQHAELNVVPSLEEGFGLTVLEGAACGVPVICASASSLPEVLDEPAAYFDPADPADMARAIERALDDGEHQEVLRRASSAAARRWRWDHVVTDIVAAIDAAASTRRLDEIVAPGERYAVVDRDRGRLAARVRELGRSHPAAGVVAALDTGGSDIRSPFDGDIVPAGAIGRYVKPHDFDRIDAMPDH